MADSLPFPSSSPMPGTAPAPHKEPDADAPVVSAAVAKFKSCRWRRPPEDGPECCGHRDVLPMAGTSGFDAEAWCPDCTFYKLRRTPKKRSAEDYRY
ncbi:MAG TPA: hypothetical protein VG222_05055 [Vicinamibacterales bacterium]|nr:hypothetical protein [Vicinamibacterales bacterium]